MPNVKNNFSNLEFNYNLSSKHISIFNLILLKSSSNQENMKKLMIISNGDDRVLLYIRCNIQLYYLLESRLFLHSVLQIYLKL